EQRMAGPRSVAEEALVLWVVTGELRHELRSDLVVRLPDHRTECRHDARALGAATLHCRDRRFRDAGERTAPARMRGTDYARLRVGEQDWSAVGGAHRDR